MKRSKWQLAIPILIGLAIVPFSIREAYTQDEGGLEVIELVEDETKPEPMPEQQSTLSASDDVDSSEVMQIDQVDTEPVPIHVVPPVYPYIARKAGLTGKVFLKFMVNVDGSVSDVSVLQGKAIFQKAAIDAISQFRFKPAEHNGKVVAVWMTQPIDFALVFREQQNTPSVSGNADSSVVEALKYDEIEVIYDEVEKIKGNVKYLLRFGKRVEVLAYDEVEEKPHPIDFVTPVRNV